MRNTICLLAYCWIALMLNGCTTNIISGEEMEEQVIQGLSQRYPEDEFEVMNVWNASASGDKTRQYTSKVSSKNFERKDFWLHLERRNDSIIITEDTYASLLLSEVYLDMMRANLPQTDNIFYDVELGYYNEDSPYLKNKTEAKQYFENNHNIRWVDYIGIYTSDYDDNEAMEDIVSSLAYDLVEIYPGGHDIEVYFYPIELKASNLHFLSDEDMADKAPEKDKYFAFWLFQWSKSQ